MRIGRTIIDTDNMTANDMTVIINELRAIRKRKADAENFCERMKNLIEEAKEEGFTFLDKDCGQVWQAEDFTLYDERV